MVPSTPWTIIQSILRGSMCAWVYSSLPCVLYSFEIWIWWQVMSQMCSQHILRWEALETVWKLPWWLLPPLRKSVVVCFSLVLGSFKKNEQAWKYVINKISIGQNRTTYSLNVLNIIQSIQPTCYSGSPDSAICPSSCLTNDVQDACYVTKKPESCKLARLSFTKKFRPWHWQPPDV